MSGLVWLNVVVVLAALLGCATESGGADADAGVTLDRGGPIAMDQAVEDRGAADRGVPDRGATGPMVDWCVLQYPPTLTLAAGESSEDIYGRVFQVGCTEGEAVCDGVEAELGYGPRDVDPASTPDAWTWATAAHNAAHTDTNNDEFMARLTIADPGEYAYVYRARLGSGAWTICDLDGTENGLQLNQLGQVVVEGSGAEIGWCQIHHPEGTSTAPGLPTEPIYGRVYVAGCTEGAEQCATVRSQVGYGSVGEAPTATWTWVDGTYNHGHVADDNDEYLAPLPIPDAGTYAYAYRFSVDDGATWTFCDTQGDDGFSVDQLPQVTVAVRSVEWCSLQFPATLEGRSGTEVGPVFGRAYSPGCTEGPVQCRGLLMQAGLGPDGVDPRHQPEAFTWSNGAYNSAHVEDDNDEHQAHLLAQEGRYLVRFSGDGGATWRYCDQGGGEFDPAEMGRLSLLPPD